MKSSREVASKDIFTDLIVMMLAAVRSGSRLHFERFEICFFVIVCVVQGLCALSSGAAHEIQGQHRGRPAVS